MRNSSGLYGTSLSLFLDLYELTMAYGYWKSGRAEDESVFHLFFRSAPFKGGFTVCCGLASAVDFISGLKFETSDIEYLRRLRGNDGRPLFERRFLSYLAALEFKVDVDAIPEGTPVFPQEPLVRVTGPLLACQLLETPLLNFINFQSLIATKAARICHACGDEPVLEFGARRAQGVDGALTAARAAYIGGCGATSNVLAGKLLGIPVKGTFAHSWVMAFDDELESFKAYSKAMPNNCLFLVDTYDSLGGVRNAIKVAKNLRRQGHEILGIRLDSGDLAALSLEARKLLDKAGFTDAVIIATNDLDEHAISALKTKGAAINIWGVGTRLVTAYDQPALDGVYKLGAVRRKGRGWDYKLKLSENSSKSSLPGILQVRRFSGSRGFAADMIYDIRTGDGKNPVLMDPADPGRRKRISPDLRHDDLLIPVFRSGKKVYADQPIRKIREYCRTQLSALPASVRRLDGPLSYQCGIEEELFRLREKLECDIRTKEGCGI